MKFIKKIFSYAIGNGLSKFISVIILPIYTNYLNPQEYGRVDLVYYTVSIIISFVFMECWTALLRFIYDDYSENNKKVVFSNILFLSLLLMIPYILIQYIISMFIAVEYAWISCIYGVFYLLLQILQMYARANKKTNQFVLSGIINSLFQLCVTYLFIIVLNIGALTVLIAPIIGTVAACIYLIYQLKCLKIISFKYIDKKLLKKMFLFSIPLAFNSIAFWAMNNINRYFAAYFLGYESSSYVSIAAKLTMIITLAASVYSLAWQEDAFESSSENTKYTKYTRMNSIYLMIFTIATSFSIIFVKLIFPFVVGEQYIGALQILPIYFVAVYFSGISSFLGQIFGAEKRTGTLLSSTIVGTIINIIVVVTLINKVGIIIIPIGSMLGFLGCVGMRYYNLNKFVSVTLNFKDVISSFTLICISILMFNYQQNLVLFIIFAIILLLFVYILYGKMIKNMIKTLFRKVH